MITELNLSPECGILTTHMFRHHLSSVHLSFLKFKSNSGNLSTYLYWSFYHSPFFSASCFLWFLRTHYCPQIYNFVFPVPCVTCLVSAVQDSALEISDSHFYMSLRSILAGLRIPQSPRQFCRQCSVFCLKAEAPKSPLLNDTPVDSDAHPGLRNTALGSGHIAPCLFFLEPLLGHDSISPSSALRRDNDGSICKVSPMSQVL